MDFTLSEELQMIRDMARDFVMNELLPIEREVLVRDAQPGGARPEQSRRMPIPREKMVALKTKAVEQGLWAMNAPEEFGGGGLSALGGCLVAEELGKSFVDFDFGDVPPQLFDANAEQREKFLKPIIAGEKEIAFAAREPDGDEITTRATHDAEGWELNGIKIAVQADLFLVIAQTDAGATCFIVEHQVTQDGKLVLQKTRVPDSNVLGEIGGAFALGKKYRNANLVRAGARKVGVASRLLELSAQYARDWKALGQSLAVRPAVQRWLAEMAIEIDAARWLIYRAAVANDANQDAKADAMRAHLFASETAQRAHDRTIEIYGGPAPMMPRVNRDEQILELERFQIANSLMQ
ncbi:MAG: acyl-CoA/acyl-ACP dehydrogenase [Chloroflexi bacterium]|nr:acyl-CoA/acyl-ACP dehydrogenase [Chloroflexota bacterium]